MKNRVDSITQAVTYPLPFLHNNSSILWKPIKSAQSNQIYEKEIYKHRPNAANMNSRLEGGCTYLVYRKPDG